MIDWAKPYSYAVRVTALTDSWADGAEIANVTDASVERGIDEDAPLLESCSLEVASDSPAWATTWARIDATVTQGGATERVSLGCFRLELEGADYGNGGYTLDLSGYSVLKPLDECEMTTGEYAPYGEDCATWCAALMEKAGVPSRVESVDTALLPRNIVFGDEDTALEAVWQALSDCGLTLRIKGDGTVRIVSEPTLPSLTVGRGGEAGVQDGVDVDSDGVTYTRDYDGDVRVGDLVRVDIPRAGVSGTWTSLAQSIDLSAGLEVEEQLGTRES